MIKFYVEYVPRRFNGVRSVEDPTGKHAPAVSSSWPQRIEEAVHHQVIRLDVGEKDLDSA